MRSHWTVSAKISVFYHIKRCISVKYLTSVEPAMVCVFCMNEQSTLNWNMSSVNPQCKYWMNDKRAKLWQNHERSNAHAYRLRALLDSVPQTRNAANDKPLYWCWYCVIAVFFVEIFLYPFSSFPFPSLWKAAFISIFSRTGNWDCSLCFVFFLLHVFFVSAMCWQWIISV